MKKYWDKIEIGDYLPELNSDAISRLKIAYFAAAADEFNPLNLDDEQAKLAGFNHVYAPGLMALGLVEQTLKSFAINMKIVSLSFTFQRLIWPGDRLIIKGFLIRKYQQEKECRSEFTIWCENQLQEIVLKGNATCLLFKSIEDEHKSNSSIPTISIASHDHLLLKCAHLQKYIDQDNIKTSSKQKEMV